MGLPHSRDSFEREKVVKPTDVFDLDSADKGNRVWAHWACEQRGGGTEGGGWADMSGGASGGGGWRLTHTAARC